MPLIEGLIAAPGAHVVAASITPETLILAVVGHKGAMYLNTWDQDQVGRRSLGRGWLPVDGVRTQANGPVELVGWPGRRTAAIVTGVDGHIYTTALNAVDNGATFDWSSQAPLLAERVPPGAPVVGVPRAPDKLDIFVIGGDGGIYTAACDCGFDGGAWRGWLRIPGLTTAPGGYVTAVSRSFGRLDVFVVAKDRRVYRTSWDQERAEDGWRGWSLVASGASAKPGSRVHAVSRSYDRLDVFVVGDDGGVHTAGWWGGAREPAWGGWWTIPGLKSMPGSCVTAVSRAPEKLDVFVVATDGEVATAAYDDHIQGSNWRGWWPVAGGRAKPGSGISVVAPVPTKLHAFLAGLDGVIWAASWDETLPDGVWRGWWSVPPST